MRLSRILIGAVICAICFGFATLGITSAVQYKPFGVPDHLREEYEQTIAHLETQEKLSASKTLKAKARVSKSVHDFGLLNPHSTATHSFEVRNDGDAPLKLEVVDSTCKCTVGDLTTPFVDPGGSTEVTLTWNTGYQAEEYKQSVTLSTNDPRRKTLSLTVKGTVRAQLVIPEEMAFKKVNWGETAEGSFIVHSQLWDDFTITDVKGDDFRDFDWFVEPVDTNDVQLGDSEAKTAYRVKVWSYCESYGHYTGKITVTVRPPGNQDPIVREVAATGAVQSAISFHSPEIHSTDGLDIGTIPRGPRREFHVVVRSHGKGEHKMEILDVEPKELEYTIKPQGIEGNYRLTIAVPKDCPRVLFRGDHKHGYVKVGDPDNKQRTNWFPLRGAVIDLGK